MSGLNKIGLSYPSEETYMITKCHAPGWFVSILKTVKILKFGTPQTIAIIVLKIEKFDVTVH